MLEEMTFNVSLNLSLVIWSSADKAFMPHIWQNVLCQKSNNYCEFLKVQGIFVIVKYLRGVFIRELDDLEIY